MELSVNSAANGAVTVVEVGGEVDVYTAPQMREALDQVIAEGRVEIVVDLERVSFMDSTGLGVLVGRLKAVRVHGGMLRVVCTQDRILKIFKITGLDKVFHVHQDVDVAVDAAVAEAG